MISASAINAPATQIVSRVLTDVAEFRHLSVAEIDLDRFGGLKLSGEGGISPRERVVHRSGHGAGVDRDLAAAIREQLLVDRRDGIGEGLHEARVGQRGGRGLPELRVGGPVGIQLFRELCLERLADRALDGRRLEQLVGG